MENFIFECKTKIIFGAASLSHLSDEIKRHGNKVLLHHYGDGVIEKIGLYDKVVAILRENGAEVFELCGVKPNPRLSLAKEGIALCKTHKIDFILAVGGGSVIDSAKTISVGAKYEGDVWDFYAGKCTPQEALPLGVVLTIPATGSESSNGAVITNEEGWLKRPLHSELLRPNFSILDPLVTMSLPTFQTMAGGFDIMSHVMERYFSPTKDTELTDRLCEATMKTVISCLRKLQRDPKDYAARADIMWAGSIAHNDLLGTGRVTDWASHMIGHEIGAATDLAHGATLSIVTPAWMQYVYKYNLARFVQFAVRVWNVEQDFQSPEETALAGIRKLRNFLREIGLPTSMGQAKLNSVELETLAEKCTRSGTVGNIKKLDRGDVFNILELAL